jgi:hypothetical protein
MELLTATVIRTLRACKRTTNTEIRSSAVAAIRRAERYARNPPRRMPQHIALCLAHRPCAGSFPVVLRYLNLGRAAGSSLFELIRGIVRLTDSLRHGRAQHMKSYGQIIEIICQNQNG